MNCDDVREHWSLYHDSEGDTALHFDVNAHLAECPACAEWFVRQSYLETRIEEQLQPATATEELWSNLLAEAGIVAVERPRTWLYFTTLACAVALLISAIATWASIANGRGASLSQLSADWHERLAAGEQRVPFRSDSDLAVEEYLRREVSFPVRCPPRKDSGFAVEGAGTASFAGEPAVYVVGSVDGAPVSLFILSRDSLVSFPHQRQAMAREVVHRCQEGQYEMAASIVDRNVVLVVGKTKPDKLLRILKAYGSYPHDRA
ncbi:MAG: zf-HC2 domain-containing protein [Pirellulales bacterium]